MSFQTRGCRIKKPPTIQDFPSITCQQIHENEMRYISSIHLLHLLLLPWVSLDHQLMHLSRNRLCFSLRPIHLLGVQQIHVLQRKTGYEIGHE